MGLILKIVLFLPDKAIDLIDEACATIKVEMDSVPVSLDKLTRKIMLLEIERQSLKKEKDEQSKKRLQELDDQLYELKLKETKLKEDFSKEKEINQAILDKKKLLENCIWTLK